MLDRSGCLAPDLAGAVERLAALVRACERNLDPTRQERAIELLQAVDLVHRAGLTRLVAYLGELDDTTRRAALADPASRLLLELYDLLPAESAEPPAAFVPLDEVRVVPAPRRAWAPVTSLAELPPDGLLSTMLEGSRVLVARVGDRIVAYEDGSGANPLPVGLGRREDDVVVCPWHGCRYDLATGRRLDIAGDALIELPVEVADGQVRIELTDRPAIATLGSEAWP